MGDYSGEIYKINLLLIFVASEFLSTAKLEEKWNKLFPVLVTKKGFKFLRSYAFQNHF